MDNEKMVKVEDVNATLAFGINCFDAGHRKGIRDGLVLASFWGLCAYAGYKIGEVIAPTVYSIIDKIKSKKEA